VKLNIPFTGEEVDFIAMAEQWGIAPYPSESSPLVTFMNATTSNISSHSAVTFKS
jgi:hypothetical protein